MRGGGEWASPCKTKKVLISPRLQRLLVGAFSVAAVMVLWLGLAGGATVKVPSAPRSPVAVSLNGGATIRWTAPLTNGGAAVSGYVATAMPSGKTCSTTGALTCKILGLTNGQRVVITVKARNRIGLSQPSAGVLVGP